MAFNGYRVLSRSKNYFFAFLLLCSAASLSFLTIFTSLAKTECKCSEQESSPISTPKAQTKTPAEELTAPQDSPPETTIDPTAFYFETEWNDTSFSMSDPAFLDYLRRYVLRPPLPVNYNLRYQMGDPSANDGQNKIVLNLLENKRHGIFVEAGANDGEYLSNTLLLERDYGWSGLLVEPDDLVFHRLLSKQRKAWLANVCLSTTRTPRKASFLHNRRFPDTSSLSGLPGNNVRHQRRYIDEKIVQCVPVFSLLMALKMTEIDYFSLDIEGAELDVLKTIPFHRVAIKVMSIEYDHIVRVPGAEDELKKLMSENGFVKVAKVTRESARDYIYAHKSILPTVARPWVI